MGLELSFSDDPYRRLGFEYFISTYGIIPSSSENDISLNIILPKVPSTFHKDITGWISIFGKAVPVFDIPENLTDKGEILLEYHDPAGNSYPCAVRTPDGILMGVDLFAHMGKIISGEMESVWGSLETDRELLLQSPFMSYYGRFFVELFRDHHICKNRPFVRKSFWPGGHPFAVCLTHDIDEVKKTYQWITRPIKSLKTGDFSGFFHQCVSFLDMLRGFEPYWTFKQLVDCETQLGVTSSMYFLEEKGKVNVFDRRTWRHAGRRYQWKNPKISALIRMLHEKGWEVGLHGSFDSYNNAELILMEKKALENVLGETVWGGRQHNLNLEIPDTWIYQQNAGLRYDTTLGYNRYLGFRWGICHPFHPYPGKNVPHLSLLEIPLIIEDLPFFRHPKRDDITNNIIQEIRYHQGVLTLLWHHTVFNNHEYPGWGDAYKNIIEYCKTQNAWITHAKKIARWWLERENSRYVVEYKDNMVKIIPLADCQPCYIDIDLPQGMEVIHLEKAIITSRNQTTVTICTSPLNFSESAIIRFSEISHGDKN